MSKITLKRLLILPIGLFGINVIFFCSIFGINEENNEYINEVLNKLTYLADWVGE